MMENGSEENIPYQLYQSSKELDGISTKDQSLLSETGRMNAVNNTAIQIQVAFKAGQS
jgi:hypothetical protein